MERLAFAHPAFLWGLLATAVPILVHLFNRRRPRPLAFGAIDFVLRSQRQKARRLRLRQILLLALRCLLIAGIAIALARPSLRPKDGVAATPTGPQATALVLDASLSMRYRDGSQTLFERAKSEALAALDRLGPDEPATVGLCAGPGGFEGGALPAPSFDRAAARRTLQQAQPGYLTSDLTSCLAAAARALGESPVLGKRIIAFSDLAAHSLRLDAPPPLVPPPPGTPGAAPVRPNVVVVDAARQRELPNAAIVATHVSPAPQLGPRGYEVTATVANFSSAPVSGLPIALRVQGQLTTKGFVDVPARGTAKKVLGAVLPPGPVVGRVELSRAEAQGLDEDDAHDFVVHVPRDVRALIVDGAPSALRTRDEAFFVEAALAPQRTAGRISAQLLDADAAFTKPLEGYDVVLLLNVPAPPKPFAEQLRAFVAAGGGLFVALGDHADPDAFNASLGSLLPRPLHLLKTATEPGSPGAEEHAARFGLIDWQHPIFRIFGNAEREGLQSSRAYRYALLSAEPSDAPARARTLASFDDGAPALVEGQVGQGRVLLYTSTASRAWSDWAIRSSFLPVLQQSVSYLAGALDERAPEARLVGDEKPLSPPRGMRIAAVTGPDGKPLSLRRERAAAPAAAPAAQGAKPPPPDAAAAAVGPLPLPGLYKVSIAPELGGPAREDPTLAFVAHTDPRESDLRRVDEAELKAQLGGAGSAQVAASAQAAEQGRGTPLWSALLLLGVLALLGEGALTRK
jgi:hypothetical protein